VQDGIIAITYSDIDSYVHSNLPIVSIDRHFSEDVVYVTSDNYGGGQLAVNKLIENGCKKIAFMGTNPVKPTDVKNRRLGFEEECIAKGIEYIIFNENEPVKDLEGKVEVFIKENKNIDGIFTINDFFGLMVMKILKKLNIKVPEDIQLIGYDGVKMSIEQDLIMSTIRQPVEQMANEAVNALFKIFNNEQFNKRIVLPVNYIKGKSTKG